MPSTTRRRGRPRSGEPSARDRIIAAAEDVFAERGYDGATTRAIAERAGVDPASLHHHFGTKADLFAEVSSLPIRPDQALPEILDGPIDQIGERLVRYVLTALDDPATRKRAVVAIRAGIGHRATTPLVAGFLEREVIGKLIARLDVADAPLRASLVASQMGGLLMARFVLRLPALQDASTDELAVRVGGTIQRYLTD